MPNRSQSLVVYVDVDDTLIRSSGTKRIPMSNAVQHVRELHEAGVQLYLWSSGGADYARDTAIHLGIAECFVAFLPKPHVLVDDQHPSEWRCLLHVHPFQVSGQSAKQYAVATFESEDRSSRSSFAEPVFATKVESAGASQDRVIVDVASNRTLVVVADGAGGVAGSAVIAEAICDKLRERFRATPDGCTWLTEVRHLDEELAKSSAGGMSTVIVLVIEAGVVRGASVGDSEAWLISGSQIIDLTAAQNRKPLLGSGDAVPVEFGPTPFAGRLLVGTDGLFKYARAERIAAVASAEPVERAVGALVDLVRLSNGSLQDDVAVALLHVAG